MLKVIMATCFMGLAFAACNTMEGVGKDVKNAGDSLEKSAKKNKP